MYNFYFCYQSFHFSFYVNSFQLARKLGYITNKYIIIITVYIIVTKHPVRRLCTFVGNTHYIVGQGIVLDYPLAIKTDKRIILQQLHEYALIIIVLLSMDIAEII